MQTLGKFSLFTMILALALVVGCGKKKPSPEATSEDSTPQETQETKENQDEPGTLETRCFDGDPAACDQLGH